MRADDLGAAVGGMGNAPDEAVPLHPRERIGFYAVEAVELVAGVVNIAPMGLNTRDGSAATRKRRNRLVAAREVPAG